jgi:hypothetical protein
MRFSLSLVGSVNSGCSPSDFELFMCELRCPSVDHARQALGPRVAQNSYRLLPNLLPNQLRRAGKENDNGTRISFVFRTVREAAVPSGTSETEFQDRCCSDILCPSLPFCDLQLLPGTVSSGL